MVLVLVLGLVQAVRDETRKRVQVKRWKRCGVKSK